MCVYIYIYICIYVCIHIYIYIYGVASRTRERSRAPRLLPLWTAWARSRLVVTSPRWININLSFICSTNIGWYGNSHYDDIIPTASYTTASHWFSYIR